MFLALCLATVLLFAVLGWATHACQERGGPALERLFQSLRVLVLAGLFFTVVFCANYHLCSTGLQRSMGSERLTKDPFLRLMFKGSGLRSNHVFALVVVCCSFLSAALFLKYFSATMEAVRSRSWRQDTLGFAMVVFKLLLAAAFAYVCLRFDTTLLVFRTATMMYSDNDLAGVPSELPDLNHIVARHSGTMGAWILAALYLFYPVSIFLADLHLASSIARVSDASRQYCAARSQAVVAVQTPPAPLLPQPQAPNVLDPAMPAPGGAAPWIRPVPFNPGPQNDGARLQQPVEA
jgi:hypothetical protein